MRGYEPERVTTAARGQRAGLRRIGGTAMENKKLLKDLVVLWVSVTALVCAALNMHVARNMLEGKDS